MHSCLQRVRAASRLSCFIFSCKKMRMVKDSPELLGGRFADAVIIQHTGSNAILTAPSHLCL